MLKVSGRRCVIVGGGSVAVRRARALVEAGAGVTVIAPQLEAGLAELPVERHARRYAGGDLAGAWLVVIATDDPATNEAAASEARQRGVLINRTDAPDEGDVTIPAHARHGPITLAVDTSGISASAAAAIRRELSAALPEHWPTLLETVAPFRERIREQYAGEARTALLRRLTDEQSVNILKTHGRDALAARCRRLVDGGPAGE